MLPTGLLHDTTKGLDIQVPLRVHDCDALPAFLRVEELVVAPTDSRQHPALLLQPLNHLTAMHRLQIIQKPVIG